MLLTWHRADVLNQKSHLPSSEKAPLSSFRSLATFLYSTVGQHNKSSSSFLFFLVMMTPSVQSVRHLPCTAFPPCVRVNAPWCSFCWVFFGGEMQKVNSKVVRKRVKVEDGCLISLCVASWFDGDRSTVISAPHTMTAVPHDPRWMDVKGGDSTEVTIPSRETKQIRTTVGSTKRCNVPDLNKWLQWHSYTLWNMNF